MTDFLGVEFSKLGLDRNLGHGLKRGERIMVTKCDTAHKLSTQTGIGCSGLEG